MRNKFCTIQCVLTMIAGLEVARTTVKMVRISECHCLVFGAPAIDGAKNGTVYSNLAAQFSSQ